MTKLEGAKMTKLGGPKMTKSLGPRGGKDTELRRQGQERNCRWEASLQVPPLCTRASRGNCKMPLKEIN